MEKLFNEETVTKLMNRHQRTSTEDRGCVYWYCSCGRFIDSLRNMPEHIEDVLKGTKADAYRLKNGTFKTTRKL